MILKERVSFWEICETTYNIVNDVCQPDVKKLKLIPTALDTLDTHKRFGRSLHQAEIGFDVCGFFVGRECVPEQ